MDHESLPDYIEQSGKESRREQRRATQLEQLQETCKDYIFANAPKEYEKLKDYIHACIAQAKEGPPYYLEAENVDYSVSRGNVVATTSCNHADENTQSIIVTVRFAERANRITSRSRSETNAFRPVVLSQNGPILWTPGEPIEWARYEEYMTIEQLAEWLLARLTQDYVDTLTEGC